MSATTPIITVFADRFGKRILDTKAMTPITIAKMIRSTLPAVSKESLQLLKLAQFGDARSKKGCLRHDDNVTRVYGIEADYDGEVMSMAAAVDLVRKAGFAAVFYTSPSHTPERPRWRALVPLAMAIEGTPDELRDSRAHWVGVLNAVLGGVLAGESFALSQAFYFGPIEGRPEPEVVRLSGVCIDQMDDPPDPIGPAKRTRDDPGHQTDDRSRDLDHKVRDAVRASWTDDRIHDEYDTHPHAADQPDPARSVQRCIDRWAKERPAPMDIPTRNRVNWKQIHAFRLRPPPRSWILPSWIPAGESTLLAGDGGIGKSLLVQHLATAFAMRRQYIGVPEKALKVLAWMGEDDHDELWRRQLVINQRMGVGLGELEGPLELLSYAKEDITLAATVYGELRQTPMINELTTQVRDYGSQLVILDNSSRIFGGNENSRADVIRFLSWVAKACHPAGVIVLAHPAKSEGSEYSGSTGWEAGVRARLYMSTAKPGAKVDADQDPGYGTNERWLSLRKANYSERTCRRLEYQDGYLCPDELTAPPRKLTPEEQRATVIGIIKRLAELQQFGVIASNSSYYLPKMASDFKLLAGMTQHQFIEVTRTLLTEGALVTAPVGKYANRSERYAIAVPGVPE